MMKIMRHRWQIRFVHWVTALSIFILFFSGFGQMPVYKRYFVDQMPGLSWSSDYAITLHLHYYGAMILIFISVYYLFYLFLSKETDVLPKKGDVKESLLILLSLLGLAEEPENDKYLAEQRMAFAVTAVSILGLIITGLIKVLKNLPDTSIPLSLSFWATQIHNILTVILLISVVIHLLAFLIKDNRPLFSSMFTGRISLDYAKHRHSLWINRIEARNSKDKHIH
ncbi:MAG: cytochrome b/b6 domain-containing protein [Syntrophomonadaceae bacterium]|jgi:formate dehydrogenase gamma subunit|nr:cytochrome b/b6 domain-containing protein [Syntrophomonadaceae bacterium]